MLLAAGCSGGSDDGSSLTAADGATGGAGKASNLGPDKGGAAGGAQAGGKQGTDPSNGVSGASGTAKGGSSSGSAGASSTQPGAGGGSMGAGKGAAGSAGGWIGSSGAAGAGGGAPSGGAAGAGGGPGGASGAAGAAGAPVCDHDTAHELYLSADDSNSMAGAEVARGLIEQGQLVYKGLRTYEFLNYYGFAYPPAPPGQIDVSAQLHDNPDGTFNLQIGVRAPDQTAAERRPYNLTLSVDVSSSMAWGPDGNTALDRVRQACVSLAGQLRQGDVVSIVSWSDDQVVTLDSHEPSGPGDATLIDKCSTLGAYGRTDLSAGLTKAYEVAKKNFAPTRINRVILLSDGGANVSTETRKLIENAAQDSAGEAIYLMGAGVGDPWNYNDKLMNVVTDVGRGAYVFLDTPAEAERMFGPRLLSNLEVAARAVQVKVTLPPTFFVEEFHGEQISTNPDEVKPQHLAMGDAMIFHQVIQSCDPAAAPNDAKLTVEATYEDPVTRAPKVATFTATLGDLLASDTALLRKGDAVVAFAEALKKVQVAPTDAAAVVELDKASTVIAKASISLGSDPELDELRSLVKKYRGRFDGTGAPPVTPNPKQSSPIVPDCSSCAGLGLDALRCAADLCDDSVFLDQSYTSPTGAPTAGTFAAMTRFGAPTNGLAPQQGGSYVVIGSGPVAGTAHSTAVGTMSMPDPYGPNKSAPIFDAMEWKVKLRAPANANGFSFRYVYFSEEYDDYIGSTFNDKFYVVLRAGSTASGEPTVINFSACRDQSGYYDFICGQGLENCTPGQKYCYVAINTALSECCWYQGCPGGTAKTDISGTGFECAPAQGSDSQSSGSSTGWLETQWPIEPNEEFELTFHIHDTGDGIYDSAAIIDRIVFLENVVPGTNGVTQ